MLQRGLLFGLYDAIVHCLGHSLDVVLIPEQPLITTMCNLVVCNRAIGCRIVADAHHTSSLASVVIPKEHTQAQVSPALRSIPRLPWWFMRGWHCDPNAGGGLGIATCEGTSWQARRRRRIQRLTKRRRPHPCERGLGGCPSVVPFVLGTSGAWRSSYPLLQSAICETRFTRSSYEQRPSAFCNV